MKKEIRQVDKKNNILQVTTVDERWYCKEVKDKVTGLPDFAYVPSVTWITEFYPKGIAFYKWLANKGWDEAESIKQAAGDKGSKVHEAIERLIDGLKVKMTDKVLNKATGEQDELSLEEWECLVSFKSWFDKVTPKVITKESVVFKDSDYAGTIDLVCEIDGKVWLIDFKTSAYIWPSHKLQVSAYKHAYTNKIDHLGILQLGYNRNKSGYKFTEVDDEFDLFKSAQQIWRHEAGNEKPKQKDYPLFLEIGGQNGQNDETVSKQKK